MSTQTIKIPLICLLLLTTISACTSTNVTQPTCVPLEVEPGQVALKVSDGSYPHIYTYLGPTSDGRHQFRVGMFHPSYIGSGFALGGEYSTEMYVLLPDAPIKDIHFDVRIAFVDASDDRLTYVIQKPTNPGGIPSDWCELPQE